MYAGCVFCGQTEYRRVVDAELLTETLFDSEGRSSRRSSWRYRILVDGQRERRAGGEALVEGISFEEAGGPVASANNKTDRMPGTQNQPEA